MSLVNLSSINYNTWSEMRIDTSCSPLATSTSISGSSPEALPWVSTVARIEFLNSSNRMW